MLKIPHNLFRRTKEMAYADYYERALTNASRSTKDWGTPFNSFWCCYGKCLGASRPLSFGFRISSWTNTTGAKATLNGEDLPLPSAAWTSDDKLTIQLPLILTTEPIDADRPFTTVLSAYELQQWGLRYLD
ncbi:hypothetical protein AB3S75_010606 [Citrus x aurantiifolia]